MADWTSVLASALDEVEYGIVLLDKEMRARFINRAYHQMLSLPVPPAGKVYHYADILDFARTVALWDIPASATDSYVANRMNLVQSGAQQPEHLKFRDGRIFKFVCKVLPDGGRMLTYADITDLVQTAEQLQILATVDDLTKVLNRRQFLASFESEFNRAISHERPLAVMMIDADDFKRINDEHGHSVGDEVLRAVAERCRSIIRKTDIVGRVGGEEFAAALTETDLPNAVQTAERLRRGVAEEPFEIGEARLRVTISIGVADRHSEDKDAGQLLRLADRALYAAKARGRNQVVAEPR
ncbi:MAG: diguanylate cyclase [Alphaproteobacteria bacterium]|nr:diguanylate cyclase [Alphaproteobacteria bacterium]MBV8408468.1 diguanylate cyclase [Alphaproteobacteria bacterium]